MSNSPKSPKPPRFSPTKLLTYQECPRQYYFQYLLKLPQRPTAAMSFGSSLHRALQQSYEAGGPKAHDAEALAAGLQEQWVDAGFADQETAAQFLAAGQEMLRSYHAEAQQEEGTAVLLEKRLTASYQDVAFLGIVDRVDRLLDATLEVIDYKSTRWVPESAADVNPDHLQQLGLYAYLAEQHLGGAVSYASIHYLRAGKRLRLEMTPAWLEDVLQTSYGTARAILEDREFMPFFGPHCQGCSYLRACQRLGTGPAPL